MKRALQILSILLIMTGSGWANESIDPTISPALFQHDTEVTVTYDVTGTPLANLSNAYIWVWIPGKNTDAKYNINPASSNATATNNARFIKTEDNGRTYFALTFVPSAFFDGDISAETQIGMLLKGDDWADGQTSDYLATFWDGSFQISLTSPTQRPLFVSDGEEILITGETPVDADFELYINEVLVNQQTATSNFSYTHTVVGAEGNGIIRLEATAGSSTNEQSFQYLISGPSPLAEKPAGIIAGINYDDDQTKATLCLWAPGKESVYVLGDFTDWEVSPAFLMNRSGEFFWIAISGLTIGQEYAFQYLVDESIFVADPYADKILDPEDQHIPDEAYPNLKDYPTEALHNDWYFNRLSVLQTGQQSYNWQVANFEKPAKEKLVVYELLVRDFFESGERTYKNLTDTITYLKRLGINAIELMPIMEYNGNESWGYNPTFMFAPDKYYGTKDALKEFVDVCHQNGIAVILDIALNHQDIPNTYVMLDFDFTTMKPEPDNKWFNVDAKHPFNVFNDMNHESAYTKKYIDTINHYWLNEYKIDGFRFDLSKGFTQVNNPNNVNAWSDYDPSRIAILKRMADQIWLHTPDAYVILEHLAVNQEEKELAEYRAGEGKGMMLWGKMTDQYNQLTMGFIENSDIRNVSYETRGWSVPHLVSYMESHDEERLMYKNELYGNFSSSYSVKDTVTALERQAAANVMFYTIPGPKMLWQFGEVGYDYSINHCEDGSNNSNCRLSIKPVRWDYMEEARRRYVYSHLSDLLSLRDQYDVFTSGDADFGTAASLVKQAIIKNVPYNSAPVSTDEMNAVVVSNFELTKQDVVVSFPHEGTWYDYYYEGQPVQVEESTKTITLAPGAYRIFTDVSIGASAVTGAEDEITFVSADVFPNPITGHFTISQKEGVVKDVTMYSLHGMMIKPSHVVDNVWDAAAAHPGLYIMKIETNKGIRYTKVVKN